MIENEKKRENKFQTNNLLNENIPFDEIVLISEEKERIIITKREALILAEEQGLDLFCVAPNQTPPICKLMDYKRLVYLNKKKNKKKKEPKEREIRMTVNISDNDLNIKMQKVYSWLDKGSIVKFLIRANNIEEKQIEMGIKKSESLISLIKQKFSNIELRKPMKIFRRNISFVLSLISKKKS